MRSEYRFPRSAIFLMVVLLVAVVVAIESARSISAGEETHAISAWVILRVFMFGAGLMCVTGAVGYVILSALRRTGVDRLADIPTRLRQR